MEPIVSSRSSVKFLSGSILEIEFWKKLSFLKDFRPYNSCKLSICMQYWRCNYVRSSRALSPYKSPNLFNDRFKILTLFAFYIPFKLLNWFFLRSSSYNAGIIGIFYKLSILFVNKLSFFKLCRSAKFFKLSKSCILLLFKFIVFKCG